MKFAIKSLSQFVHDLPKDINKIKEQLINLGIEVESITSINNNNDNDDNNNIENYILEVAVAANRADLLSIMGVARELGIINNAEFSLPKVQVISKDLLIEQASQSIQSTLTEKSALSKGSELTGKSSHLDLKLQDLKIEVLASRACPKYLAAAIKNLNPQDLITPDWIKIVLENAGFSLISPIVDITNYVMLELGQPLHAFDLNKIINNQIIVRYALPNESIKLLNNHIINLHQEDLVIADPNKALALAGIMGGLESSITAETDSILLECAYFEPIGIRKSVLRHNLLTDAAQRFTRNIDANVLQALALKRCLELIQELSNREKTKARITSYYEIVDQKSLPIVTVIKLEYSKIKQVLGIELPISNVKKILTNLGIKIVDLIEDNFELTIPSWRHDLKIQEDIIEELARFIGYNNIIPQTVYLPLKFKKSNLINLNKKNKVNINSDPNILSFNNFNKELQFKYCLANRGYQEIISYSFIDLEFAKKFYTQDYGVENFYQLKNPISQNMNVMRNSLLPGLVSALIYNQNRQHSRLRIFEVGNIFSLDKNHNYNQNAINQFIETKKIAGLVNGKMFPENWQFNQDIDFYKLKKDVLSIIGIVNSVDNVNFIAARSAGLRPTSEPWGLELYRGLHPYQSAFIKIGDLNIGVIGALHPELLIELEINDPVYIFELDLNLLNQSVRLKQFKEISRFPTIRRDFSILIDLDIEVSEIYKIVYNSCGSLFKELIFFDVYLGDRLPKNKKSIAFGVILQHPERTLVDEEVNEISNAIINNLTLIGAQLRS